MFTRIFVYRLSPAGVLLVHTCTQVHMHTMHTFMHTYMLAAYVFRPTKHDECWASVQGILFMCTLSTNCVCVCVCMCVRYKLKHPKLCLSRVASRYVKACRFQEAQILIPTLSRYVAPRTLPVLIIILIISSLNRRRPNTNDDYDNTDIEKEDNHRGNNNDTTYCNNSTNTNKYNDRTIHLDVPSARIPPPKPRRTPGKPSKPLNPINPKPCTPKNLEPGSFCVRPEIVPWKQSELSLDHIDRSAIGWLLQT